jgi:hypothetical protein
MPHNLSSAKKSPGAADAAAAGAAAAGAAGEAAGAVAAAEAAARPGDVAAGARPIVPRRMIVPLAGECEERIFGGCTGRAMGSPVRFDTPKPSVSMPGGFALLCEDDKRVS